jgi:hypothetical protein
MGLLAHSLSAGEYDPPCRHGPARGWYVERDGRRFALLTDPQRAAPGWFSFRVEHLTADAEDLRHLHAGGFWADAGGLVFRDRASGEVVPGVAVASGADWLLRHAGRVLLRGLA